MLIRNSDDVRMFVFASFCEVHFQVVLTVFLQKLNFLFECTFVLVLKILLQYLMQCCVVQVQQDCNLLC